MPSTGPPTITTAGSQLAAAMGFHGPSGAGKTSLATCFPHPIVAMVRDQGLLPLVDAGMVPAVSHFDPIESLGELESRVSWLEGGDHEYRTLILDGLTGLEQVLCEHVCENFFEGSVASFNAYGRGWDAVVNAFASFLRRLDRLRARKIAVVILAHSKVANFANPTGPDYSRYVPDVKDKLWSLLHKWLDLFAYLTFDIDITAVAGGKGKATGSARRVLHTEERPGFVAKNRYGLPFAIRGEGAGAGPLYAAFAAAMKEAKSRSKFPETATSNAKESA
jgi:hypothetical protein